MSPPPSRRVTPDPREVPSRATLVPAPADPEDDLDPLARELLRQIRNHNADELKVNAEGFDGLRSEFAGLRKDFSRMADRMEKNQRAAFWLVGAIVVVALVAVVGWVESSRLASASARVLWERRTSARRRAISWIRLSSSYTRVDNSVVFSAVRSSLSRYSVSLTVIVMSDAVRPLMNPISAS